MSIGLRNIKDPVELARTIRRRIQGNTKGLGYWAAVDAEFKLPHKKIERWNTLKENG